MRNGKSKYVAMKNLIVHATTVKNSDQNIYASMARMSCNYKCPSGDFGDRL